MSKVYIVTAGSYSDYHICNVFSTREKAQEWADKADFNSSMWDDVHYISEYDVDPTSSLTNESFKMIYYKGDAYKCIDFEDISNMNVSNIEWLYSDEAIKQYNLTKIKNVVFVPKDVLLMELKDFASGCSLGDTGFYIVDVPFYNDINIMNKIVYDSVTEFKAAKECI